jgi:hypothetical protein
MLPSTTRKDRHRTANPGGIQSNIGTSPAPWATAKRATTPTPGQNRKAWLEAWVGGPIDRWNELEKPKVPQDWKKRWEAHNRRIGRQEPSGPSLGRVRYVPEDTEPTTRVLALHKHLRKAESSVLVQARTGKIGFAKFLCDRRVPGYAIGQCLCGHGLENPPTHRFILPEGTGATTPPTYRRINRL